MQAYPLKTTPCYKTMPWGGTGLNTIYGKDSPYALTGESWEAASHQNGSTPVQNGPYAGLTPGDLAEKFGESFLGRLTKGKSFPVLFKLIDAQENLSLQVHPNDAYAKRDGDNGKTEMWIILQAEPGAGLFLGFETPVSKEEYARLIAENKLDSALHFIEAKAGDAFFLPAGLVHAIGKGLVIAEIQQSSDATYRVYDWGRVGPDGKGRPLHIEKALDVSDTSAKGSKADTITVDQSHVKITFLPSCPLFGARHMEIRDCFHGQTRGDSFHILFCAEGEAFVSAGGEDVLLSKGDTIIVPACAEDYTVKCTSAADCAEVLCFFVPDFKKDYEKPLTNAGIPLDVIHRLYKDKQA